MNDDLGEFVGRGFALLRDRLKAVEARKALDGINGQDGTNGTNGKDGADGINGTNGNDGADGAAGSDGIDGRNGDKGADGNDGETIQGEAGEKGDQGEAGAQGNVGNNGTNGQDGTDGKDATATDGKDGVGVDNTSVDKRGHLIVTLTDGREIDAGKLPKGKDGSQFHGMIAGGPSAASTAAPQSIIYVTSPDQLAGTLQSDKLYFIDGTVDMQSTQIVVPAGGLNIGGAGFDVSCLTSTADNYTMFINADGSYSGNLYLTSLDVIVSGTSSQVFDLDAKENGSNIEFNSTNFVACTSLGEAANFRQGLARNVGWVSITDGLTMSGTWAGGFAAFDSIIVGAPMSGVLFRAGAGLTLGGSFRSNINALSLGTNGGIFCDFAPSNILLDAGFALSGLRTNPLSNTLPNMPATSTKALIKDCVGIGNTYPGAAHIPVADSVITITSQNTLTQITGAMTLVEPYWFSTANTNGLRSDCAQAVEGRADGTMSFSGQANTEISVQLRHFIAATSSYENVGPEYEATINGGLLGTLASNVSFGATVTMQQGDRAEVWIKNRSGTNNITLKSGGQFEVLGR